MKLNLNATNRNTLTAIVIVFCLLSVLMTLSPRAKSYYQPRPINIEIAEEDDGSIFDLKYDIDCVPGVPDAGYYTKTSGPGGICDDQKFVKEQADAKIIGGIGGSLI